MVLFFCRRCLDIRRLDDRYKEAHVECSCGRPMIRVLGEDLPPSDAEVFLSGLQKGFALAASRPAFTFWRQLLWLSSGLGRVPWKIGGRVALLGCLLLVILLLWRLSENGRYQIQGYAGSTALRVLDTRTGAVKIYAPMHGQVRDSPEWLVIDPATGTIERRPWRMDIPARRE